MQAVTRATLTIQERASFSLKGLTAVSLHCEQFVKYECYHSRMRWYAWWVSRDSMKMTYWGNAKPRGNGLTCTCGVNKTCTKAWYHCNCEVGGQVRSAVSDGGRSTNF